MKEIEKKKLGLSDLYYPSSWSSEPNKLADVVQQGVKELALRFKVLPDDCDKLRRFDAAKFGLLSALAYPRASRKRLGVCHAWHSWLFFFDDQAEEDEAMGKNPAKLRRHMETHLSVLQSGELPSHPTPLALFTFDIRNRLLAHASPMWFYRFYIDVKNYFFGGTLKGSENWTNNIVPDPQTYMNLRKYDSAMYTCQDLLEIAENIELPKKVFDHESIQQLRDLCTRVVAFSNDLFSYQKEVLRHQSPNNLVHVLMTHQSLSFEDAVAHAVEMINEDVQAFVELEGKLPKWGPEIDAKVQAYIYGQKAWMRGNITWSLETGRYASEDSPFPELRTESFVVKHPSPHNLSSPRL